MPTIIIIVFTSYDSLNAPKKNSIAEDSIGGQRESVSN